MEPTIHAWKFGQMDTPGFCFFFLKVSSHFSFSFPPVFVFLSSFYPPTVVLKKKSMQLISRFWAMLENSSNGWLNRCFKFWRYQSNTFILWPQRKKWKFFLCFIFPPFWCTFFQGILKSNSLRKRNKKKIPYYRRILLHHRELRSDAIVGKKRVKAQTEEEKAAASQLPSKTDQMHQKEAEKGKIYYIVCWFVLFLVPFFSNVCEEKPRKVLLPVAPL